METRVEHTATATITTTDAYVETMHTATLDQVNTDGAPVKRYRIGVTYTYGAHTYTIVGVRKYHDDDHSYWLVRFDGDQAIYELTADKIKDRVGDDRKQPRGGSASDTPNGAAIRSKRTAKETADAVQAKYDRVVQEISKQVGKLVATDAITAALQELTAAIATARDQRIEAITNAELAAHMQRAERLAAIEQELPNLQAQAMQAMQQGDYARVMSLSKQVTELQAEQLQLQRAEAAYTHHVDSSTEQEQE